MYLIRSGTGQLRDGDTATPLTAGDCFVSPLGEPHQIQNTGETDLQYYVIADSPSSDVIYYPDSGKWFVKPQRKSLRMTETDYFAGEEAHD